METLASLDVSALRPGGKTLLGLLIGLAVPSCLTPAVAAAQARYDLSFFFVYMPGVLIIAYVYGLLPGVVSATASAALVIYFLVGEPGLTAGKLATHGLPGALFLLTGVVMALAGDEYGRSREQLQADLDESRRRVRREAVLARISETLSAGTLTAEQAQVVCQESSELIEAACAIAVLDPQTDVLSLQGYHAADIGGRPSRQDLERLLAADSASVRSPMDTNGDAVVVVSRATGPGDVGSQPDRADWLSALGVRAALVAPLRSGDEAFGVFLALSAEARSWTELETRTTGLIAERVARVIDRGRRADRRARQVRNAQVLADVMLEFYEDQPLAALLDRAARRCGEALGEWCGVYMLGSDGPETEVGGLYHSDPDRRKRLEAMLPIAPLGLGSPWTQDVLERRQPAVIRTSDPSAQALLPRFPHLQEALTSLGATSILSVPVRVGPDTLGILALGSETRRHWADEDVELASAIADRTAAAVRIVRLLNAERQARVNAEQQTRRIAAISRVIRIASQFLDLGTVFDEFAEALRSLVPFARLAVSLYDAETDRLTVPYFEGPDPGALARRLEGRKTGTARGRVLDTGDPFIRQDTTETDEFAEDRILRAVGVRSYLIVPMSVGGRTLGTLKLDHVETGAYDPSHASLIQPIADHLAITLAHSSLYDEAQRRASELAETLQRALLPLELPQVPFVGLAAIYRAADPDARIGGDWYDALLLPDGKLMISIGDVAGRGLAAAVGMGQVRSMARAYAFEEQTPGRILESVNAMLCQAASVPFLSAWIGILDPYLRELLYASAGHPPARIVRGSAASTLNGGGPPLGTSSGNRYSNQRMILTPGTRLLVYTDGLIEVTHDVLQGEARLLHAAIATVDLPIREAAEAIIERALDGATPADDIALMIAELLPATAPLVLEVSAVPKSLGHIRQAVRAFSERQGLSPEQVDAAVIAVGEATLNVVEHAYRGRLGKIVVEGTIRGDEMILSVRDFGQWRPQVERGRGRGTRIMRAFADRVATRSGAHGTTVELSWRIVPAADGEPA